MLALLLLMGFVYYTTIFIFIEDWVGLQSSAGSLNALIFTFLVSLCPSLSSFAFSLTQVLSQLPLYLMLKRLGSRMKSVGKIAYNQDTVTSVPHTSLQGLVIAESAEGVF
ncbi:hypothetical protein FNV43_RR14972 [Rhamnella rubrinervis]|uniref:Uncharacterized protein n=1 Tax=Rhamnella rubrinervis TaxID=2594499 RepID=A0A8K0H3T2_9ROSA|nr:hypothetical protein FNV43_RR14972 [Rhamnella rubrinervis]